MAENKNSFILYCDLIHTINHLSDEQAGKVFKHLLEYVNDKNPLTDDVVTKIAFEPIKQALKRDLKKYEGTRKGKSDAGILGNLKRYQSDLYDAVISEKMSLKEAQEVAKSRTESQSDTKLAVSVSDSVSVSDRINIDWDKLLELFNNKFGRRVRVIPDKAKKQIRDRFKEGYSKQDFVVAMDNAKKDQYHIDNNYKYITLEFLSRPDKFERYSSNHNFKTHSKIL